MGVDDKKSSKESKVNITYETLFEMLRQEKNRAELQKLNAEFLSDVSSYVKGKLEILSSSGQTGLFADQERASTEKQIVNIRRILKELYDRREKKVLAMAVNKARTGSNLIDTSGLLAQEKEMFDSLVGTLMFFRKELLAKLIEGSICGVSLISSSDEDNNSEQDSGCAGLSDSSDSSVSDESDEPVESTDSERSGFKDDLSENDTGGALDAAEIVSEAAQTGSEISSEPKELKTDSKIEDEKVTVKFVHSVPKFAGLDLEVYGPFQEEDVVALPSAIADVLVKKGHARVSEAQ